MQPIRADSGQFATLFADDGEDWSNSFAKVRSRLFDNRNVSLIEHVRTLEPIYWRVYLDLALGYAALIAAVLLLCVMQSYGVSLILLIPIGWIVIGYCAMFLAGFIHEGAH